MWRLKTLILAVCAVVALATQAMALPPLSPPVANDDSLVHLAQSSTSQTVVDGNRRCQIIKSCNYRRGGAYRGCISTYTCRVCRLVKTQCEIGGRSGNCHRMQCTWGG